MQRDKFIINETSEEYTYLTEIDDATINYNGAPADYEDIADYFPRGGLKGTVIA